MDIDVSMLLVPAGVAFVVGIVVQLFVKPGLKRRYKDKPHENYSFILNGIALGLGIGLGLLGTVAFNWGSVTAAMLMTAALVGLVGGASAIGGAESLGNFQKARQ